MSPADKQLFLREMRKYIRENNYYTDGTIKIDNLWLVGWVAAEFKDRKSSMKVLISNEYGLLGNLMYKHMQDPDASITSAMERMDQKLIIEAIAKSDSRVIHRNEFDIDPYAMRLLICHDRKYAKHLTPEVRNSKEFLSSIVTVYPEILTEVSSKIINDTAFALSLIILREI